MPTTKPTRRQFLESCSLSVCALASTRFSRFDIAHRLPLFEFAYPDVTLRSQPHEDQLRNTHSVLMGLSDDSLRAMSGQPAPGEELDTGGWGPDEQLRAPDSDVLFKA